MRLRTNRFDSPSHIAHRYTPIYADWSTAEEVDGRDLARDPCHESHCDLRDLHGRVQGTTDWCLPLIPNLLVDSLVSLLPSPLASVHFLTASRHVPMADEGKELGNQVAQRRPNGL